MFIFQMIHPLKPEEVYYIFPCILGKKHGFSNLQAATYTFKTEPEDTGAEKKQLEAKVKVVSLYVGLQKLGSELRSVEVVFFRLLQS